ncbi:MAG: MBOAT family protein [Atopobiaceae bacterium]|nr:MBOAT family protein [Atopobiaceae bacterium]
MASYFSIGFFAILLPFTLVAYAVLPKRARWVVLLVMSYAFLFIMSRWLVAFTAVSTVSVYALARCIDVIYAKRNEELKQTKGGKRALKQRYKNKARWVLVLAIVINVGILVFLKYLQFFGSIASSIAGLFGASVLFEAPSIGVPLGISFYTLMAVSYMVDVYREKAKADKHLGKVALFLVFFPQIMEGPICRFDQTAEALMEGRPITSQNLYAGSTRMLMGFVKKMVVADRMDRYVSSVYDSYGTFDGGVLLLTAIIYTLQLYCDFSGTMDMALGMGRLFDVSLPENFKQPFFSKTTSEFWQRWHITLGSWFKDYVFYPVSFSKPCKSLSTKTRKRFGKQIGPLMISSIALFCVWLLNGLWHGAGSQYLFFGMYYFVLIAAGGFVEVWAQNFTTKHQVDRTSTPYVAMRVARTLCFVFLGELIFRSASASDAVAIMGRIATNFSLEGITNGSMLVKGVEVADFAIAALFMVGVFVLDALAERGTSWLDWAVSRNTLGRCALWVALLAIVVIFGAYGYGYVPVDPMYAQY